MTIGLSAQPFRSFGDSFRAFFVRCFAAVLLFMASLLSSARCAEPPAEPGSDQLGGKAPDSITGNPAAENELPGTGLAGRLLHLPEDCGLRLGGFWLVDTNGLISGGAQPGKWSWNSALIIGANFDAEKLLRWKGASFGMQFLQFNGQNTNWPKLAACKAITACQAPSRLIAPSFTSFGTGRLSSTIRSSSGSGR